MLHNRVIILLKGCQSMNILVTGGTGFVGQFLSDTLIQNGHHVYILTRSPGAYTSDENKTYIDYYVDAQALPSIHAVINLAGDTLFGYWTTSKKKAILHSRLEATERLIQMMNQMTVKPKVLINGSAVGYYGTSTEKMFTEKTTRPGDDFLAKVVVAWEKCAEQAASLGIRTVYTRFGVILGKNHGALPLMSLPIKLFAGGKIGSGEQWIPWIHIDDVVQMIIFSIENEDLEGPINVTAPHPQRNKDFIKVLANVLKRPYWFPTPSPLLKIALGDMSTLITQGQYVLPHKAQAHDYLFKFSTVEAALEDIFS